MTDPKTLPVGTIKLHFDSDHHRIEKAYRNFFFNNNLKHFRLYHVIAILFYQTFVFVDLLTVPERLFFFLTIRFAMVCPLFCIGIGLTYMSWYRRFYPPILAFLVWLTAGGYIAMGAVAPVDYHFIYFIGFLASLAAGSALLRLPVVTAAGVNCTAGLAYGIVQSSLGALEPTVFTAYLACLIGFEVLLMIIVYALERSKREDFYAVYRLWPDRDNSRRAATEHVDGDAARTGAGNRSMDAANANRKLDGMLPICASCKKIRNKKGSWDPIELYIGARSEAEFTHTICPDCKRKLYPELVEAPQPP